MHFPVRRHVALWLFLASPTLFSQPMPVPDIGNVVSESDVIVVGSVQSIAEEGTAVLLIRGQPTTAQLLVADILADRVLKGAIDAPTLRVRFARPESPVGYGGLTRWSYRLVFLKRKDGYFEFVSPYFPSVLAVPTASLLGDDPASKVAHAIAGVIDAPSTTYYEKASAIYDLSTLKNPTSIEVLRRAINHTDGNVQLSAAAALLALNDISALPLAEKALLRDSDWIGDAVAHNLRHAISALNVPGAIPALSRLLTAADAETRRAAASGLRRVKSPEAISALAAALDDRDEEVRYYAVIALAEITGEIAWRPSMDAFRSAEEKYLSYWKERVKRQK